MGQRRPQCGPQFLQTFASVAQQRVVVSHAQRCEDGTYPIDQGHALGHELLPFASASSGILVVLCRDRHHRAHTLFAA